MINLYTWPTPNGRKISILLEELQVPYKVIPIDIEKDEQFSKEFSLISPNNKIPAITDLETKTNIFESGAIMLYLANKYKKYLSDKSYWSIMEWFMFQLTQVGPYLGQAHQFLYYHSGKSKFAEDKYINYVKRTYRTLDSRLENNEYLGTEYSIADIATWPWIARFERHRVDLKNYPNVLRWYKLISKRSAVIKGYNVVGKFEKIPLT
ncbi:MAG TPA: glutathione S-transferase N-terminal domain-containing protein [Pelagibacteraceae bacterium]|jgi:GST-like protein|nr:glutathione S-transferase N-terminal domain-containing protein [Alphaproteobacteria bacterium]HJO76598.1 glutathione S-transferase N-terminal domain-containing protein [Pelagibacteraceae bacterium]